MTTTTSRWISATLAAIGITIGILAGGGGVHTAPTHNLADYGADISADNSEAHSAEGGVRHMGDHEHSSRYFERMDGGDR